MSASLFLRSSVFDSTWFHVFSLFVAINTLIYLGLTLSKFIPWPRQVHPRRVRRFFGIETGQQLGDERTVLDISETPSPFTAGRRIVAARSISTALGLLGVIVITGVIVEQTALSHPGNLGAAINVAFGVIALISSVTLARREDGGKTAIWTWSVIATLFVLNMCFWSVHLHRPLDLANAIVVLVLISPIALSWPESLISTAVAGSATIAAFVVEYGSAGISGTVPVVGAVLSGLILLHLRASAIDELTSTAIALRRHPTTDPQTGLLAWEAFANLAPNIFSLAGSLEGEVHMTRVEIPDVDQIKTDYGPTYVDQVISAVGRSLALLVRPGELLARRDESSFAILGLGEGKETDLREGVDELLLKAQVSLGKRPIHVTVRSVSTHDASNYERLLA